MKKFSILAATAAALLMTGSGPALAQAGAQQPATIEGKPNLNGIWQAMNTANWNLEPHAAGPNPVADRQVGATGAIPAGLGVVEGGTIPYKPEALERLSQHRQHLINYDPEAACYLPGIPRATYLPYPFQILQGTNKIVLAYEYAGASRTIHMEPVGDSPAPTWMGWSRGRWDGDTLVVEVTDFNEETWFDRAGNFHSDALKVTERYTPASPHHLIYQATIEDPKVFTRPWTLRMPLYRRFEREKQLLEYKCVEFVEQLMYGHLGVIDPATGLRNK